MPEAYIALGANLGDPPQKIEQALRSLAALPGTHLRRRSSLYRSAPLGPVDQPDFCNAVCLIETTLEPLPLLDALQLIERAAGRTRGRHWGPRTLDLDLLLIPGVARADARLQLPHPHLHERNFVLLPLCEIAPDLEIPGHGHVRALCASVTGGRIARWHDINVADG